MNIKAIMLGLALTPLLAAPALAVPAEASRVVSCGLPGGGATTDQQNGAGTTLCSPGEAFGITAKASAQFEPVPYVSAEVVAVPTPQVAQTLMFYGVTAVRKDGTPIPGGTVIPVRVDLEASISAELIYTSGKLPLAAGLASMTPRAAMSCSR